MATSLFNVAPFLSHCNSLRFLGKGSAVSETPANIGRDNVHGWSENFVLMIELRKNILTFRDVIDLPPCDDVSSPINELIIGTVEDLHRLYPKVVSHPPIEIGNICIEQGLSLLYNALKCIGHSWAKNHKWPEMENLGQDSEDSLDKIEAVLSKLKHMTAIARKIFDVMEENERRDRKSGAGIVGSTIGDSLTESYCNTKHMTCPSPDTPTSVPPPELSKVAEPLLLPLRLKALENLKPVGFKHLFSLNLSPTSSTTKNSTLDSNPSPLAMAPPPPPPIGAGKALRPKKANTKLKRSLHMGSLYRTLKGKVEGNGLNGKHVKGKRSHIGGLSAGGKQGMADALAEMTKRSAYFQQIEEDVEKHSKSILEIKAAINSFQTKDMSELVKFHKYVEQQLEKLTDETQVLGRFEGFPTKKLESLRTATSLYMKLEETLNTLKNWKVVGPLGQQIDKVESFFKKIKVEIDALERTKDEESKRFQSHNITVDFNILVRIKEAMVDVSSSIMELALEERKNKKMLWRAFELAYGVYSFAGGQDERADMLTKELAHEIQKSDHSLHG